MKQGKSGGGADWVGVGRSGLKTKSPVLSSRGMEGADGIWGEGVKVWLQDKTRAFLG